MWPSLSHTLWVHHQRLIYQVRRFKYFGAIQIILDYFEHNICFQESALFFGIFSLSGLGPGLQLHPSLGICPKLDQISPIYKANLVLVNLYKYLGFDQTPIPPVGTKSQFLPTNKIKGPPLSLSSNKKQNNWMKVSWINWTDWVNLRDQLDRLDQFISV